MRILPVLMLLLPAVSAAAEPYAVLAGDDVLDRAEVAALISGETLVYYDEGRSRYAVGGAYSYSYASGATAYGAYEVRPDGEVCVQFHNGRSRCDRFVRSHGRTVLLTAKGERFPLRPE